MSPFVPHIGLRRDSSHSPSAFSSLLRDQVSASAPVDAGLVGRRNDPKLNPGFSPSLSAPRTMGSTVALRIHRDAMLPFAGGGCVPCSLGPGRGSCRRQTGAYIRSPSRGPSGRPFSGTSFSSSGIFLSFLLLLVFFLCSRRLDITYYQKSPGCPSIRISNSSVVTRSAPATARSAATVWSALQQPVRSPKWIGKAEWRWS